MGTDNKLVNFPSSLLKNICVDQVSDLIIEEKLKLKGYKIGYIIDPYDISNYCYPFGLSSKIDIDSFRKRMTDEDKIDEFIAFDILFQDKNNIFYILDEHLDELYNFQIAVKNQALLGLRIIDTNSILINKFLENKSIYETLDFINRIEESNLSLILSIAMGYLREGFKKIERIIKEEKRIITDESSISESKEISELVKIISDTNPSGISDEISYFGNMIAEKIGKDEYDIERRKYNFKNDSDVVDRVISINKELINVKNKNLCFFISSTSLAFRWFQLPKIEKNSLSETFEKINRLIKDSLPFLNGYKINPHRTSSQLFLSLILDEENKENKIENLKRFRDSIAINFKHNIDDNNWDLRDEFWEKRIQKFRERSENFALLSQFSKYKETIKEAKKLKTLQNYKILHNIFNKILESGKGLDNIYELRDQNWRIYNYEKVFIESYHLGLKNLNNLVKSGLKIEDIVLKLIKAGDDKIAGRYHILPVVFNLRNSKSQKILKLYIELIFTTKIQKCNKDFFTNFFNTWLNKTAEALAETNGDKEIELLRSLILLLLPDVPNKGKIVLNRINEIIEYEITEENQYLKQEYYYIISWVARRMNDFDKANLYSKMGLQNDETDPRFYHSLALSLYCNHDNYKSKEQQISTLLKTIEYSEKSIALYRNNTNSIEVRKSIISLYNTIVYCRSIIWDLNFSDNMIGEEIPEIRRILINEVKNKEENFDHFLEFIHTEAYLELLEFYYYEKRGDITTSTNKIYSAANTISKALKLDFSDQDCLDLQLQITTAANSMLEGK